MIEQFASQLVDWIFHLGYAGIFLLMAVESSFVPFPSEVVLIPAGYLAYKGEMSIVAILLASTLGSLAGAFLNYFIALYFGRGFLVRFGKYFFISQSTLAKLDAFFQKHGHISTFSGRLIPGIRQLISIPAGIAKMNLLEFAIYTALGAALWSLVLILLGYFIGEEQELLKRYLKEITIAAMLFVTLILVWYYRQNKKKEQ